MKKNDNTENQNQTMPINGLNLSKGDLLKRYHEARLKHYLYGLVSFAMTAMFYISFTSPEWLTKLSSGNINIAISAGVWALLGLLFSVAITVLIMHSHTTDRGASRLGAYAMIIALGVTFNVFTETASSMDRVDERVTAKSEQSGVFKALISKIKQSSGQSNTALTKAKNDFADAISTKKARCKHGAGYSARLCLKWTMRADEYKTAIELHEKGASSELSQTVKEAKEAGHNKEYAQMIVKMTMEQLGVSFLVATALISLFIIGTFEVLGIMIGGDYKKYRDALPLHGIDLHRGREIKYLKKNLKRQSEIDEAINQHKIEQANLELKRLQDARRTQKRIRILQAEIKQLTTKKQPDYSLATAELMPENSEYSSTGIGFLADKNTPKSKLADKAPKTAESSAVKHHSSVSGSPCINTDKSPCNNTDVRVNNTDKSPCNNTDKIKPKNGVAGEKIHCPNCNNIFTRKTYNHRFCSAKCKDDYHNDGNEKRLQAKRANLRKIKRGAK